MTPSELSGRQKKDDKKEKADDNSVISKLSDDFVILIFKLPDNIVNWTLKSKFSSISINLTIILHLGILWWSFFFIVRA